jgi:hypothetical protein
VVKLVDAEDSKSSARKGMPVRFRPPAPNKIKGLAEIGLSPFALQNCSLWPFLAILKAKKRQKYKGSLVLLDLKSYNMSNAFQPAPIRSDVWKEFYKCKCAQEEKISIASPAAKRAHAFIPPWIIAKMCMSGESCRV